MISFIITKIDFQKNNLIEFIENTINWLINKNIVTLKETEDQLSKIIQELMIKDNVCLKPKNKKINLIYSLFNDHINKKKKKKELRTLLNLNIFIKIFKAELINVIQNCTKISKQIIASSSSSLLLSDRDSNCNIEESSKQKAIIFKYLLNSNIINNNDNKEEKIISESDKFSKYYNVDSVIKKQEKEVNELKLQYSALKSFSDLNKCILCKFRTRSIIFDPCNHLLFCLYCVQDKNLQSFCKVCNIQINKTILVNYN